MTLRRAESLRRNPNEEKAYLGLSILGLFGTAHFTARLLLVARESYPSRTSLLRQIQFPLMHGRAPAKAGEVAILLICLEERHSSELNATSARIANCEHEVVTSAIPLDRSFT